MLNNNHSLILIVGHSMGGHGALNLATHYPDRSLALISLAGWIKKEDYGDSNLFFRYLHRLIDNHLCLHPLATSSATLQLYCGINFISNFDIFPLISPCDIFSINDLILILKIIGQCDVM